MPPSNCHRRGGAYRLAAPPPGGAIACLLNGAAIYWPARVVDAVGIELVDVAHDLAAVGKQLAVPDDLARRLRPVLQAGYVLHTTDVNR